MENLSKESDRELEDDEDESAKMTADDFNCQYKMIENIMLPLMESMGGNKTKSKNDDKSE